jgi:hypothetical protein
VGALDTIDRGEGIYVRDVTSIGHAHPGILAALTERGARLLQNPDAGPTYSPPRTRLHSQPSMT